MSKYREYRTCRTCNGLNVVTADGQPGVYYWCPECNGAGKVWEGKQYIPQSEPYRFLALPSEAKPSRRANLRKWRGTPCAYCKRPMDIEPRKPTRDHALPKSRGGKQGANIIICCAACNCDKANLAIWEWLAVLEGKGDPRAEHVRVAWERLKPEHEAAYGGKDEPPDERHARSSGAPGQPQAQAG